MLCVLEFREEEKFEIVKSLAQLFAEVDINDDKHMEWSEFTQYIIDSVMMKRGGNRDSEKTSKNKRVENAETDSNVAIKMPNGGAFEEEDSESESESTIAKSKASKPRDKGKAHIILS